MTIEQRINEMLHTRQYKITLKKNESTLKVDELRDLGMWSNPTKGHYVVTERSLRDKYAAPELFKASFFKITGLESSDVSIESTYGPMTPQRATDSDWY